eukprot:6131357-Prymnesium_polylepis.1
MDRSWMTTLFDRADQRQREPLEAFHAAWTLEERSRRQDSAAPKNSTAEPVAVIAPDHERFARPVTMEPWESSDDAINSFSETAMTEHHLSEAGFGLLTDAMARHELSDDEMLAALVLPGRVVLVVGLVKAPGLNGARGRVVGRPKEDRFPIRIAGKDQAVLVRWRNLRPGCNSGALIEADIAAVL